MSPAGSARRHTGDRPALDGDRRRAAGEPTLAEQAAAAQAARLAEVARDPTLQEVLAAFPAPAGRHPAAQRLPAQSAGSLERKAKRP